MTIQKLAESQKLFMREAAIKYHQAMPGSPAEEYLASRGLGGPVAEKLDRFLLGYVAEPLLGHERYEGTLAIPYLRWSPEHDWIVVNIRFRCIQDHEHTGHGKYESMPGTSTWIYNTNAMLRDSSRLAVIEGEIDTITSELCGIPSIGIPGAMAWKPYMALPLLGYRDLIVVGDGDGPGREFANTVVSDIPGSRALGMPDGYDVNSLVLAQGAGEYIRRITR